MYSLKIDDYLKRYPFAEKVAEVKSPHKVIEDERPIIVYYEDISCSNNKKSNFVLFNNGEFVGNAIWFPCSVLNEDRFLIGKEMIEELLSSSDFIDLDKELNGQAACEELKDVYKNCNECPNLEKECLGAMYSIPTHKNLWKIENKWNEKYGEDSLEHKKYLTSKMISEMNHFMWACGKDKDLIKEVLTYAKEHTNNKHKKLFK